MSAVATHMRSISILVVACGAMGAGCGHSAAAPDAADDCSMDPRQDTFVVGLEKMGSGGTLDFKLMSVSPAPPARGDNTWIVQINAVAAGVVGAPVTGAQLAATPFMPDHQHGTPIPVVITEMPTAGQYQLKPVNMWMPGLWETTIEAAQGASAPDSAVYRFCVPI